jgi:hypothetical protein
VVFLLGLLLPAAVYAQGTYPQQTPLPIPTSPAPSTITEQYVRAPADQLWYDAYRDATALFWSVSAAILIAADAQLQFQQSLVTAWGSMLDTLGTSLRGLLPLVLSVGALIGLILAFAQQWLHVEWASIRRAIVSAILVPVILGGMGGLFSVIEQTRMELAVAVGGSVFDQSNAQLGGATLPSSGGTPNRLRDLACWYLYTDCQSMTQLTMELPAAFEQSFYTPPPDDWSTLGAETRRGYRAQAWQGLAHMVSSVVPAMLVAVDAVYQTLWTLNLGLLMLGLSFALVFAVFTMYAKMVYSMSTMILCQLGGAVIISAAQGFLIAYLWSMTLQGTTLQIVGISALTVLVYGIFALVQLTVGGLSLLMAVGVVTPDNTDAPRSAIRRGGALLMSRASVALSGAQSAVNTVDPTYRRGGHPTGAQPRWRPRGPVEL